MRFDIPSEIEQVASAVQAIEHAAVYAAALLALAWIACEWRGT